MGGGLRDNRDGTGGEERRYRRRSRPVDLDYDFLPSQVDFHRLKSKFKGFSGPVGSGKSMALCYEAIYLAYRNRGRRGVLGAPTYKMLQDATVPALIGVLDELGLPYSHWKSENRLTLNECGSEILLRSLGAMGML